MLLYLVRKEYTNQELLDAMGHPQISLWRNLEQLHEAALVKKKHYSRQEIGYIANTERLEELSLLLHQLVEAAIESPTHQVDIEALSDPLQYELLAALGLPIKEEERIE